MSFFTVITLFKENWESQLSFVGILFVYLQNYPPVIFCFHHFILRPLILWKIKLLSKIELQTGTPFVWSGLRNGVADMCINGVANTNHRLFVRNSFLLLLKALKLCSGLFLLTSLRSSLYLLLVENKFWRTTHPLTHLPTLELFS